MTATYQILRDLVEALDGAFISTWQSTAAWQKQIEAAREHIKEATMPATERPSELLPCKKCLTPVGMLMAASSPFYTCPTEGCVNHIPVARTLDAAPADPVVSAECWRRAIADIFGGDMIATVELHAIELAKENMHGT